MYTKLQKLKPNILHFGSLLFFGIGLPLLGSLIALIWLHDLRFAHVTVHAIIEGVGSVLALITALFVLSVKGSHAIFTKRETLWLASSFYAMGILDGAHALVPVGNNFVWLHSLAAFFGGVLFAGMLLQTKSLRFLEWTPNAAFIGAIAVSLFSIAMPASVPTMLGEDGFTFAARALNVFGGIGFVAAAVYLFKKFSQTNSRGYYLLSGHCLLFGSAGVLFEFSALWDAAWWWWHILRLAAYLILVFFFVEYVIVEKKSKTETTQGRWYPEQFDIWKVAPYAGFGVLTLLTLLAWQFANDVKRDRELAYFQKQIDERMQAISDRLRLYRQLVFAGHGLFAASNYVSQEEWKSFVASIDLENNLPGLKGVGFVEYVEEKNLKDFLEFNHKNDVRNLQNHPETDFPDKYIVKFIEPIEGNKNAVGLDIGFEKNRRQAVEKARDTGKMTLTRPIILVQDAEKHAGFLLFNPFYAQGTVLTTKAQRRSAFKGLVYVPFIAKDLVASIHTQKGDGIILDIYDGDETSKENLIYSENNNRSEGLQGLKMSKKLQLADRIWTLEWQENKGATISVLGRVPSIILVCGILTAILLAKFLQLLGKIYGFSAKELEDSRRKLDNIFNNAVDGIILIDYKGKVLMYNPACEKLFGYSSKEVLGNNIKMLMSKRIASKHDGYLKNYQETGEKHIIGTGREVLAMNKNGHTFPVDLSVSEIKLGGQVYYTGILRDASQRKLIEKRLKDSKEKAEETSRLKSDFVASLSHEIRTPLNGIIGTADLLIDRKLSKSYHQHISNILSSAENLLELLNDILDFSKIESGKLELESLPFNVKDMVNSTVNIMQPKANEKKIKLVLEYDNKIPKMTLGDRLRLNQVLFNLIGNAIKFTEKGQVTLKVLKSKKRAKSSQATYRFEVHDSGIGMSEKQMAVIFDKFMQADRATTRQYGGTGLGLAICYELVKMMGGRISVNSKPNKGSVFWFEVDLEEVIGGSKTSEEFKTAKRIPKTSFKGKHVLLAEDNRVNAMLVIEMLQSMGAKVSHVKNGSGVLELLQDDPRFDIILMDCHMPVMDGYDATREIKKLAKAGKVASIPIIALTANAMKSDKEVCIKTGMDDYLSKPVRKMDIYEVLSKWLQMREKVI